MKRRLVNFAAVVSVVLCVAMVPAWVRSYRISHRWSYQSNIGSALRQWHVSISYARGVIMYERTDVSGLRRAYAEYDGFYVMQSPAVSGEFRSEHGFIWGGFGYRFTPLRAAPPAWWTQRSLFVPFWPITLALAVAPAHWLVGYWRRWRSA